MVEVTIFRDYCSKIVKFAGEGHSGYAPKGADIVCAGVSALLHTTRLGLIAHLEIDAKARVRNGWLSCSLPEDLEVEARRGADTLLETLLIGLKEIEKEHPDYVKVKETLLEEKIRR